MPVLPVEEVERLDAAEAAERERHTRAGIGRMWGPPCQRAQRRMDDGSSDDGCATSFDSNCDPALTMVPWVDDFDWTADEAFIGHWWNGGRDDPTSSR